MRIGIGFILLCFIISNFPLKLYAESKSIVINEFMANPIGVDTSYEWIELFNNSSDPIDVGGWKLDSLALPSYVIEPEDFLIILRDFASFPNLTNAIKLNFSLLNTTDTITLEDSNQSIVHSITYSNPTEGKSFEYRGPLCDGFDLSNSTISEANSNYLKSCYQEEVEPIEETPVVSFPLTLEISEVYPSVNIGESEWIELYNYGENELKLEKTYLADGKDCEQVTQRNYIVGNILPYSYMLLNNPTGVSLNDSGDKISLCESDLLSLITYPQSTKGKSFSKKFSGEKYLEDTVFLTNPTPGEQNQIETVQQITISDVKQKSSGEVLLFEGVVNSPFEALYSDVFYVQDGSSGIKVIYKGDTTFEVNNLIRVQGNLKIINKEYVVEAGSIEVIGDFSEVKTHTLVSLDTQLGLVVEANGLIVKNFATGFDISTKLGVIRVSVLSRTGIDIPERKKGDSVKVVGILARDSVRYKILPYEMDSIEIYPQHSTTNNSVEESVTEEPNPEILGSNIPQELPSYYSLQKESNPIDSRVFIGIMLVSSALIILYLYIFRKDIISLLNKFNKEDKFVLPKFISRA